MTIVLDCKPTSLLASRIAWSYVIASIGAAMGGAAALIYAIRWW
ncbi:hypothetical protein [Comamonas testosteroni]|nr:hypothetical protein [Comamonas testosteroni]